MDSIVIQYEGTTTFSVTTTHSEIYDVSISSAFSLTSNVTESSPVTGGTFAVTWSNDQETWVTGTSQAITETAVFGVQVTDIAYKYVKITWTISTGELDVVNYYTAKTYE